jgi:hypothetical protein
MAGDQLAIQPQNYFELKIASSLCKSRSCATLRLRDSVLVSCSFLSIWRCDSQEPDVSLTTYVRKLTAEISKGQCCSSCVSPDERSYCIVSLTNSNYPPSRWWLGLDMHTGRGWPLICIATSVCCPDHNLSKFLSNSIPVRLPLP